MNTNHIPRGRRTKAAAFVTVTLLVSTGTLNAFGATTKTTKRSPTTKPKATVAPKATAAPAKAAFGKRSDTLYEGPGGFKVDLSKCPKDWNINQGITATEIKLFQSLPKSGPLAGFGLIGDGANSYFKYINDQGGVAGRKIVLEFKDDTYQADRTKANVTEAIAGGKHAALLTIVGTPNNLAIWNETNKECMPQLLNGTGAAQWGDVDDHPWTTGMQLDYTSEAQLWAEWVKGEYKNGAKVAALTFNNDFGKSYSLGFKAAIKDTKIQLVREEFHEPTAPNLTNQFTNIEAELPDVIILQTSGAFCTQAMAEIERRGFKGKVMMSATCGSLSQFFQPLIGQGLTGEGTYIIQTFKDVNDKEFADDAFVKLFHQVAKAQGLDDTQSTYATGWIFAWFFVEAAKVAATYEGGLNRANLLLAARGLDKPMPLALTGIATKVQGTTDAYLIEGGRVAQYKISDRRQIGTFFPVGSIIDRNGALGTWKKAQGG